MDFAPKWLYPLSTLESFVILILRFRVLVVKKWHLQHGYRPIATAQFTPGFWDITVPRPPFQAMTFCSIGPLTTIAWSAQHQRLFCVCLLPGCNFISSDILQVQSNNTLESFRQPSFKRTKGSLRHHGGCSYKGIVIMALKPSVSCLSETKEASTCKHVHKFQVPSGRWNVDVPFAVNFSTVSSPSCAQNFLRTLPLRFTDRSSTRPPDLTPNHKPPTAEKQNVPISRPDRLVRPGRPPRGVLSLHVP